jgi:hypothetical protein
MGDLRYLGKLPKDRWVRGASVAGNIGDRHGVLLKLVLWNRSERSILLKSGHAKALMAALTTAISARKSNWDQAEARYLAEMHQPTILPADWESASMMPALGSTPWKRSEGWGSRFR